MSDQIGPWASCHETDDLDFCGSHPDSVQILRLEFSHYDYKSRGTISAKDFALSMVASADMRHINKFLDRVDELDDEPCLRDIRITFEEFKNFAELRKKLQPLSLAIFSYGKVNGLLTKEDFQRAAYQMMILEVDMRTCICGGDILETEHKLYISNLVVSDYCCEVIADRPLFAD
ncbi:hypothetical protein F0562_030204 [Nyssa sinensis]|uniref:EF-hand domain-containing protein n=1 Tax=Nyssa sinensis TaxID=561372 RepID=A0A5J5B254_9ASTE|nr:hypothetical protein F0562_030204 [Nyssa sinensis]